MSVIEEVMQAALGATEERKVAALRVLKGEKPGKMRRLFSWWKDLAECQASKPRTRGCNPQGEQPWKRLR